MENILNIQLLYCIQPHSNLLDRQIVEVVAITSFYPCAKGAKGHLFLNLNTESTLLIVEFDRYKLIFNCNEMRDQGNLVYRFENINDFMKPYHPNISLLHNQ